MQSKSLKTLEDIRAAAQFILDHTEGLTFEAYQKDDVLRPAVERKFEIIGEALNRLTRSDPALMAGIPDHRQIVAFRNLLIHGYDVIDQAEVWSIVQRDVPSLCKTVDRLLHDEPMPDDS